MARKGILYRVYAEGENVVTVGHENTWRGLSNEIRDSFIEFIEKSKLDKETCYFLITILLGDRSYLDEDSRELFANGGIAHVLALSGMHVGIIVGIFMFILFPFNFIGKYKFRLFITIILLWGYAFITGFFPSIVRACVMLTFAFVAIMLERKGNALNSICLAGFVILLLSPLAIKDVGFQLSFLCVVSLILFMQPLNPIDKRYHPRLYAICGLILASVVSTFGSWTVVAYYFHQFPLMFLPVNVIVLPLIPFYIAGALLYLFLSFIGIDLQILASILDYSLHLIKELILVLSGGDKYNLAISVDALTVGLWLAGFVGFAIFLNKKKSLWIASVSCCFFVAGIGWLFYSGVGPKEEGFIICNSFRNVEIRVRQGFDETVLKNEASTLTLHEISGKRILVVDCDPKEDISASACLKPDYLVVTQRYHGKIKDINKIFSPEKIVLHNSIRRQREEELISEADSLGLPLHSIRKDRPLKEQSLR